MDAIEQAYQEGLARFQQGNHDEALAFFAQVPKTSRKLHAQALSYTGRILSLRGEYAKAEETIRRSLSMQTKMDPQSLYFLGECYFFLSRWEEAEQFLRECIIREPKFTDAYIRMGMVLKEQKRLSEATRSFELAIVNDQKAVVARYQLAQICVESEDYKRALSQLHVVKELASSYAPAFVLQGDIFGRIGDHRQAIVEYVKVVEMGKADAGLFWRLGRSFMAIKDRKQAVKAFEQAIRIDSRMWPAYFYAAQLRDEFQHYDRALAHYQALLDVEEYRTIAREAIDRLDKHKASFDITAPLVPIEDDARFDPPPVTIKVSATHTLEAVQRQLSGEIGSRRTAPLKTPTTLDNQKWVLPEEEEEAEADGAVEEANPRQRARYEGADVLDQISSALRSGAFSEVMSVLHNSTMGEIAGSLRNRFESQIDPFLKQVKIPKIPPGVMDALARKAKKKPDGRTS